MRWFELPFGRIQLLQQDIAEVIINDEVEIDFTILSHLHAALLANIEGRFSLLINAANRFSYSFEAQQTLFSLKEINAVAVVAYNITTKYTSQSLVSFRRREKLNIKIFSDRITALSWLMLENKRARIKHHTSDRNNERQ